MKLDKAGTDNFTDDNTRYWRRLVVTNSGGSPAEWVVVRVKKFQKYDEDRKGYFPVDGFIPTNLTWAYGRAKATQGRYLERLPHGSIPEYSDLADVTAPKEGDSFQFHLSFAIKQPSGCQCRGKFLLSVALQAANTNKKEEEIEIVANKWSEDVEEMRTEGFIVRFV